MQPRVFRQWGAGIPDAKPTSHAALPRKAARAKQLKPGASTLWAFLYCAGVRCHDRRHAKNSATPKNLRRRAIRPCERKKERQANINHAASLKTATSMIA